MPQLGGKRPKFNIYWVWMILAVVILSWGLLGNEKVTHTTTWDGVKEMIEKETCKNRRREQRDGRGLPETRQGRVLLRPERVQRDHRTRAPVLVQYRVARLFPTQPGKRANRIRSRSSAQFRNAPQHLGRCIYADLPDPDPRRNLVVPVAGHVARQQWRRRRDLQRRQGQSADVRQGCERQHHVQGRRRTRRS